jgi:hypothetical protein
MSRPIPASYTNALANIEDALQTIVNEFGEESFYQRNEKRFQLISDVVQQIKFFTVPFQPKKLKRSHSAVDSDAEAEDPSDVEMEEVVTVSAPPAKRPRYAKK